MRKFGYILFLILLTLNTKGQSYSGDALAFDGIDDYVEIDSNLTFSEMTVEAWIYSDNWAVDTDSSVITGNYNTDGWRIFLADSLEINIVDGDTQKNLKYDDDALTGWNHIAFSVSVDDDLRLYVNGEEVETDLTITTSLESDINVNTIIGAQVDINDGVGADSLFFDGKIDEVRIWSEVRTPASINTNMYSELDGTETNLEAYYTMSDGSGIVLTDNDESGLNNGTLNNMDDSDWVTSTAFTANDNALDFDGTEDSLIINNSFDTTNFTIEFWLNTQGISSGWSSVFSNVDTSGGFEINYLAFNPGQLRIDFSGGGSTSSEMSRGWNHVAITKTPAEILIYINGILENTYASGYDTTSENTSILGGQYQTNQLFEGQIDEFRAWSVVRTASQIREYMCQSVDPGTTGLEAYYNFNQISSSVAYDQTGNGNNGTLKNMASDTVWVSSTAVNKWLGGTSSNWSDADNWSLGTAPTSTHSLGIFNYNEGYSPTIDDSRTLRNLVVGPSATVSSTSDFSINENLIQFGTITFASDNDICEIGNDWLLESSASTTLEDSSKVTVVGDTYNEGSILLQSPADMGAAASLITEGTLTNTGTMQIERFITFGTEDADNYNWHMMTPVTDTFSAQVYFDGDYVYAYDESADTDGGASAWININTDSIMSPGEGYIVKTLLSDKTYTYSGTFNDGEIALDLTRTDDTDDQGFNLVGNPYPSPIDWNSTSGWTKSNVGNDIWIWNPADTAYAVWDGTTSTNDGSQYIYPGQAFFVQVNTGVTTGTLTMNDSVRTHSTGGVFFKSAREPLSLIKLALFDGSSKDEWAGYISEKPNTTTKFFSWNPDKSQIYSYVPATEKPLAIQKFEDLDTIQVPIGIKAQDGKNLRIEILENSFNSNEFELFLKDGEMLTPLSDIKTNGYNFTHSSSEETGRLSLFFTRYAATSSNPYANQLPEHLKIRTNQSGIELFNLLEGEKAIRVFDISGREIHNTTIMSQTYQLNLPSHGVYIIHLRDNRGTIIKKFVY